MPQTKRKRKAIFQSIITELEFYEQKFYQVRNGRCTIIPTEQYQLLLDTAATGTIQGHKPLQQTLITLTGGNVNTNLNDNAQQQISKMMVAHLHLLINIFTNTIKQPDNWTELPGNLKVATEDLEQGKIIVRTEHNNKIHYTNIRKQIENLTVPQLKNYNIGLGAANTRTANQTKLAKKYTQQILDRATDHIILVDASINNQDDTRTPIQKKIEKTGHGGYGGIHIDKTKNKIEGYFHDNV